MFKKLLFSGCAIFMTFASQAQNVETVYTYDQVLNYDIASAQDLDRDKEDRLRLPALIDQAKQFGMQAGLNYATQQINEALKQKEYQLNKVFSFGSFVIEGPHGTKLLPPVIIEGHDTFETFERGKVIRISDIDYTMISNCTFAPENPLWHAYLLRKHASPISPTIIPKNNEEREVWKENAKIGWKKGVEMAEEINESDFKRLKRDFQGMVKYHSLALQKKVESCYVSSNDMGVTGDNNNMRINDRVIAVTQDAKMNVGKSNNFYAPVLPNTNLEEKSEHKIVFDDNKTEMKPIVNPDDKLEQPIKTETIKAPKPKKTETKPKTVKPVVKKTDNSEINSLQSSKKEVKTNPGEILVQSGKKQLN